MFFLPMSGVFAVEFGNSAGHPMRYSLYFSLVFGFRWIALNDGLAGFNSRRASERIVAVPLAGGERATPFGLSLSGTFTAGLGGIEAPLSQSDYDVLALNPGPFQGMSPAEVFEKVVAIRRAVLEAIDTIGLQDPELADCLLHLYRNRRICLAFGGPPNVAAELREDGSADCGDEALNIYQIPCA